MATQHEDVVLRPATLGDAQKLYPKPTSPTLTDLELHQSRQKNANEGRWFWKGFRKLPNVKEPIGYFRWADEPEGPEPPSDLPPNAHEATCTKGPNKGRHFWAGEYKNGTKYFRWQ